MTRLTPRQRRHQKTKQSILKTAQELILEKGPEGLSLREIARRIDYSPAGLYEYFDSKDEIVAAVCAEGFERLSAYLKRVPTDQPPLKRLLELGLAYLDFAGNNPEYFNLIFTTLPTGQVSLADLTDEASPYNILTAAVQAAIDAEQLSLPAEFNVNEVAYSLWAMVHGIAVLQQTHFRHLHTDFEPIHRWALEAFVNGLKGNC